MSESKLEHVLFEVHQKTVMQAMPVSIEAYACSIRIQLSGSDTVQPSIVLSIHDGKLIASFMNGRAGRLEAPRYCMILPPSEQWEVMDRAAGNTGVGAPVTKPPSAESVFGSNTPA